MYREIKLREGSNFSCETNEIIFLDGYDKALTYFIEDNLYRLQSVLEERGGSLVYMPDLTRKILDSYRPQYYAPQIKKNISIDGLGISMTEQLKQEIIDIDFSAIRGAFIGATDNYSMYLCVVEDWNEKLIEKVFLDFFEFCGSSRVMYSTTSLIGDYKEKKPEDFADDNFHHVIKILSEEIRSKVEELRSYGVSEYIIQSLFHEEQKLSRLVITSDYKIILPDYNDMEIKMEPLPKAIYILFLRHPNGIRFKDLPDYRDELAEIYMNVSNRQDLTSIYKSIENVLDPTKNSINEKCSRIREAFISRFDERLASQYYITGIAGKKKGVLLDRDYVALNYR